MITFIHSFIHSFINIFNVEKTIVRTTNLYRQKKKNKAKNIYIDQKKYIGSAQFFLHESQPSNVCLENST